MCVFCCTPTPAPASPQNDDGSVRQDAQRANLATAEITETNNLVFAGALFNKGAFAEVGAELNHLLPGGDERLKDTEGLTLRLRAEGHVYACVLRTRELQLPQVGLGDVVCSCAVVQTVL
jgi:hypothetical protein